MTKKVSLVFPHQLFEDNPIVDRCDEVYLIEEYLYFNQYKFHKQKIAFHRASMKYYEQHLLSKGIVVRYVSAQEKVSDIRNFSPEIEKHGITEVSFIDPVDFYLEKRIREVFKLCNLKMVDSPQFLNTVNELSSFFREDKKSYFQTTFYKQQRKRLDILMDGNRPAGGKWTYDIDNRKKYPKGKIPPNVYFPSPSVFWSEAVNYTNKYFFSNVGVVTQEQIFPISPKESNLWFEQFLEYRFFDFGSYEDAIVKEQSFLHHSLLSPLINSGLIDTKYIVARSIQYAEDNEIPINSTEGFVRQIIGWREFIRGMYISKGVYSRTKNFWGFDRKIPSSFYDGTTGIEPIDETIKSILQTGYCHHIERLMVLGNFMLLCEFDPDEVYRWFMEMFIDAYDWVMVPNIYGMSQFSDGGTFATKPYIGGSNYVKKMSNYGNGNWREIWDGLFWRFIHVHHDFFKSNPRMSMMYHSLNRMTEEKREIHLKNAASFLDKM